MSEVVLITDVDTPLGGALAKLYRDDGFQVVGTNQGSEHSIANETEQESTKEGFSSIRWNRKSAVSARNVLLSCMNNFGRLDHAIIVESPDGARRLLHESALSEIDSAVDAWIKGSLFLAREIIGYFLRKKKGVLLFVSYSTQVSSEALPPLESSIRGCIQGLVQSLFSSYQTDGVVVGAFESDSPGTEEFAKYIRKTVRDKADRVFGKWHRYQGKQGLF